MERKVDRLGPLSWRTANERPPNCDRLRPPIYHRLTTAPRPASTAQICPLATGFDRRFTTDFYDRPSTDRANMCFPSCDRPSTDVYTPPYPPARWNGRPLETAALSIGLVASLETKWTAIHCGRVFPVSG
jgi:hypothetical protein